MKNKGFTLVEMIGAIIILGIIAVIAFNTYTSNLREFREDYYTSIVRELNKSGQEFFNDNRNYRPNSILGAQRVSLSMLETKHYIDEVLDYNGDSCLRDSYVVIVKESRNKYSFHACLKCLNDNYDNTEDMYCDSSWFDPNMLTFGIGESPTIYVYKGTNRDELISKLEIPVSYVRRNSKGEVIRSVRGTGEDGLPTILPKNIDVVDTNKVGTYKVTYEYKPVINGRERDTIEIEDGTVIVYETAAPGLDITYRNSIAKAGETLASISSGTTVEDSGPYLPGVTGWAQDITIKLSPVTIVEPGVTPTRYQWNKDGKWQDFCTTTNTCTVTLSADINETVQFRMVDSNGKVSQTTTPMTLSRDKTKPTCTLSVPAPDGNNNWYKTDVNISFNKNEDLKSTTDSAISGVNINNLDKSTAIINRSSSRTTNTLTENGQNITYIGYVEDQAHNYNTCSVTLNKDSITPTVTLTANKKTAGTAVATDTWSNEGLNFTLTQGTVGPSGSTIKYCKDTANTCTPNTTATSGTAITTYNTTTGTYYIRYQITSGAGKSSTVGSYKAKVDTAQPTCTLSLSGTKVGDNYISDVVVTFATHTDTGGSGVANYGLGSATGDQTATYNTNGNHTATGYIVDGAGNSNTCSVTFTRGDTFTVTLNGNGATNNGTTSVTAKYNSATISPATITLASKAYTVSGFGVDSSRNSNGASVSSTSTLTSNATLNGYYSATSGGVKVLKAATTADWNESASGYTDASGNWTRTSGATIYAQFGSMPSVTLPTITKSGYVCGWSTSSTATSISYASGATFTPTANTTMYGVCVGNTATVTIKKDGNNWSSNGMSVNLYNGTTATSYSSSVSGASVTFTGVPAGTYNVYIGKDANHKTTLIDSGVDLTVSASGSGAATVNYYTLTMTGVNMSTLTLNGTAVTSGNSVVVASGYANAISGTATSNYTFANWSKTSGTVTFGSTTTLSTTATITAASSIKATANPNNYTVTFHVNGGTAWTSTTCSSSSGFTFNSTSKTCTKTVAYGNAIGTTPSTTKSRGGKTISLVGWYGNTTATTQMPQTVTGDVTVYAGYNEATFAGGTQRTDGSGNPYKESIFQTKISGSIGTVTKIQKYTGSSCGSGSVRVDTQASPKQICAWVSSGTLYWYSDASDVFMTDDSHRLFAGYTNAATIDVSGINTSQVTDFSSAFNDAGYNVTGTFTISNLNTWNTSSAVDMSTMFLEAGKNASQWSIGNISGWDTSHVTDMNRMFLYAGANASSFSINVGTWNVSNVQNMYAMFHQAGKNATTWSVGSIGNWNVSNVTKMSNMFYEAGFNATSFQLNLASWNTGNVTTMNKMFFKAGYHAGADADNTTWSVGNLNNWNTSNVTDMSMMFYSAGYDAKKWTIGESGTSGDKKLKWDTSKVENMSHMFYQAGYSARNIFSVDVSGFDVGNVTKFDYMFYKAGYSASTTWNIGSLTNWNASSATDMHLMLAYAGHSSSNVPDIGTLKIYTKANLVGMFYNAKNIKGTVVIRKSNGTNTVTLSGEDDSNFNGTFIWYASMFHNAATTSGSSITVNYTNELNQTIPNSNPSQKYIDAIMETADGTGHHVVKGSKVS